MRYEVFQDKLIPGSAEYAMKVMLAACSLLTPALAEESWRMVSAVKHQPFVAGKRVWTRLMLGGQECFISIRPGEFRKSRPQGQETLILEAQETDAEDTVANRLEALLRFLRRYSIDREEVRQVEIFYSAFVNGRTVEGWALMFARMHVQVQSGNGDITKLIQELSVAGLYEHRVPLTEFSDAWALLNLQYMTGMWMENEIEAMYEEPMQSFQNFVYSAAHTDDREMLISKLAELGNRNYLDGITSVKEGLAAASLLQLADALSRGASQFLIARLVAHVNDNLELKVLLKYKAVQAEEGYACTQTGIMAPVRFLFEDMEEESKDIAAELMEGSSEEEVRFKRCSPLWPCFTRRFTSVLITSAKTLYGNGSVEEGIAELLTLVEGSEGASMFERAWMDFALLKAYKKQGHEEQVERYATRIAGQVVVMRVLAGSLGKDE